MLRETEDLCREHDVDILILAECELSDVKILQTINSNLERKFTAPYNQFSRLSLFYRYAPESIRLVRDTDRVTIRRIFPPLSEDFLLVALHLPSKLRMQDKEQVFECLRVMQLVKEAEARVKHDRTLVIGDFNMNPFAVGMVSADGFHAVMDRNVASKVSRKVLGQDCKYFYNPMWQLMGSAQNDCMGTNYYRGGHISYFWNTFDQVLLRPSLIQHFKIIELSIISQIRNRSLIKNNKIDKSFSDHLPVATKLNFLHIN